jgi:hypothetical protein
MKSQPTSSVNTDDSVGPTVPLQGHYSAEIMERTVWRKLDAWILPIATMFYLLSFLVSLWYFSSSFSFQLRTTVPPQHHAVLRVFP